MSEIDENRLRRDIVEVCALMHQRGLIAGADGNVSAQLSNGDILVTPAGGRKGFLRPEDIVRCAASSGEPRDPAQRPSSELAMHLAIYSVRPEVGAVVHAHPPCALAHTVLDRPLAPLMPEVYCELGDIAMVPYTRPGSEAVPRAVASMIGERVALLMSRHGSVTLGRTVLKAYDRLEVLEHAARISMMAQTMAKRDEVRGLDPNELAQLQRAVL